MERTLSIGLLSAFLICMSMVNAVPYSKYGRTCKDIGCRREEVCVLESDCNSYSRDQCGTFPTCKKSGEAGGLTCTNKICPVGQYCKTVSGTPTCVNTSPDLEFDSAGVSSVNGHRADGGTNQNHDVTHTNVNPYSNANAPPPDHHDTGSNIRPANTNFGLGYPPDPSSNNGNYPSTVNNGQKIGTDGYGYPTQNRMPQPGMNQPGNYPPYNGGYPLYPTNQQPPSTYNQYPNYPVNNRNHNTRRLYNSATECIPRIATLGFSILGLVLITKYLS